MPELCRATPGDLAAIMELERTCFDAARRASRASLRRSLRSPRQSVWVLDDGELVGALVLWHFPKTLRIYGIAIRPDRQGSGLGARLMDHARSLASGRIVLEADAADARLLRWYEAQGFERIREIPGFYLDGRAAWRLEWRPSK